MFTEDGACISFVCPCKGSACEGEVGGEHGGAVGDEAEALDAAAQVGAERVHQQRQRREERAHAGQHALRSRVVKRDHEFGPVAVHRHRRRHAAHHALAHAVAPTVRGIPEKCVENNMLCFKHLKVIKGRTEKEHCRGGGNVLFFSVSTAALLLIKHKYLLLNRFGAAC
jgi:pyruvate/2-oxoglutarate dehydrogenase complex dihydrolipoamide acyltransferase (E2) component